MRASCLVVLLRLVILDLVVVGLGLVVVCLVVIGPVVLELAVLRVLDEQVAEGELAERLGSMRRQHQAQLIHACRRRRSRWLGVRYLALHVATEDERDALARLR